MDSHLTNGVVATSEVVSSVLLASNQLLWMEQLTVCAGAHLINNSGLQVNHHTARHMLASTGLREEGVECIVTTANRLVAGHLTIGLDAVLEAEKLPARIANLNTTLAHVEAKCFTHGCKEKKEGSGRESSGGVPTVCQLEVCRVM